jgi:hypothetical protein
MGGPLLVDMTVGEVTRQSERPARRGSFPRVRQATRPDPVIGNRLRRKGVLDGVSVILFVCLVNPELPFSSLW